MYRILPSNLLVWSLIAPAVFSFQVKRATVCRSQSTLYGRRTLTKEKIFDPLNIVDTECPDPQQLVVSPSSAATPLNTLGFASAAALATLTAVSEQAVAASNSIISQGTLSPENFVPVCPASDGFYRFLQSSTVAVVGKENFVEYGPLIAGGLLRVRLELCVVESFFKEAVGPFIEQNGVSWILPWHETVETFLAGVIFALATTFILIGSTKILTVIATYADFLVGAPLRLFGGFAYDRATGKPVTLDVGLGPFKTRVIGPPEPKEGEAVEQFDIMKLSFGELVIVLVSGSLRLVGQISKVIREALEAVDSFVGRYLVLWASAYILFKFAHFKVFPDFP